MNLSDCKVGPVAAVSDIERSRAFYEGKLGLTPDPEMTGEMTAVYPAGGDSRLFVYVSPEHAGKSTATLIGWAVGDVEQMVDELTAKGVVFERYGGEIATDEKGIFTHGGDFKAAWFKDPDGNVHAINS